MDFKEYQTKDFELCKQIAAYNYDICRLEKEIAISRQEIVNLKFEQRKLLFDYSLSEDDTFTQRNLQGQIIKK